MNEKIKLLAEQANIQFYNLSTDDTDNHQMCGAEQDLEKFAELIVRECAMFSMVITDDHYDVDALYRHFGVAE